MKIAGNRSRSLAFELGRYRWLWLQIGERIDESFRQILLTILEASLFGMKAFDPYVLDLEFEHSAWNAGQVYIKIPLHQ